MYKPTTLRAYLLRAREAGLDPEEILHGSDVSWKHIETLKPLELDLIASLFDYLARRTAPDFAMQCGYACKIRDFGIVGFSMMSMPTLRDAFECLNSYCQILGHPLLNVITEEGSEWRMEFVPQRIMSDDALRFCAEASVAAVEPVIEELTDLRGSTQRVDFAFERPSSLERYSLFRTTKIRFGQSVSAYCGDRSDLDRPIRSRDGEVSSLCHQQCDKALADLMNERPLKDRLEDEMLAAAGSMPTLDEMAKSLGMSRRTLQRELSNNKLNYQQAVKDFRIRRAMRLLMEKRANVKMISYQLGYKDVGSFRRAFQDWTGQSIGQWLARQNRKGRGIHLARSSSVENLHPV